MYDALGSKVTVVELLDQLMPGCDPDLVKPLGKTNRRALRRTSCWAPGSARSRRRRTASRSRSRAPARGCSTRCWSPSGASRTAHAIDAAAAGVDRRRARLHPGRPSVAHRRARDLRDRGHRRRADARSQGLARGHGRRRGDRGPAVGVRCAGDPVGRLHGSRGRVDGADRDRGARVRDRVREGGVPVGRLRTGAGARPRRRAHEAARRARDASGARRAGSSASARAS